MSRGRHHPTLKRLIQAFAAKHACSHDKLAEYLDNNWKPNVALIDVEWDAKREVFEGDPMPSILCNPTLTARKLCRAVGHEEFLSEYTLMSDMKSIESHFGVTLREDSSSLTNWGDRNLALSDYTMWSATGTKSHPLHRLMSRPALERYICAHLLKTCLPYPRPKFDNELVYAPLNLNMVFRLLFRMHEAGYPAHWLSGILRTMLEGKLTTSVRAPRQMVQDRVSVEKVHPTLTLSIKPWVAALSTLGTIWQDLLPFGLLFPSALLRQRSTVSEYQISFPPHHDKALGRPHFMLFFWDTSSRLPPRKIRKTLLDDELGDRSEKVKGIRESGVHVLTTFRWATQTRTASFWLRSDIAESLQHGDWRAYVWRTDTYEKATEGVAVQDAIKEVRQWDD
ncbi:Uu.00g011520.m01.CDS01 [Anthostomella pinea]|uniref:Uu.00g011520.m01.CDS01 n=1 Tax=Anthostomella pinea TaxID=933095 RepID=A0AAI8VZ10_9PEZI|nr:Uu.00g011520.m01.CDS01 [Anthostomella pinea]